jgi:hypothetical protein
VRIVSGCVGGQGGGVGVELPLGRLPCLSSQLSGTSGLYPCLLLLAEPRKRPGFLLQCVGLPALRAPDGLRRCR